MKIRYIAGSYAVLLLGIMAVIYMICMEDNQALIDMVHYNGQLKQIEAGLSGIVGKEDLDQRFDCEILYLKDQDYEIRLNEALRSQAVILDLENGEDTVGKVVWNGGEKLYETLKYDLMIKLEIVCGSLLIAGMVFCFIFYVHFMEPFKRLQKFSGEIAKGNFDMPLPMNKNNFFGAFTESFDLLREELKRAKESEYQANRSKKELMEELEVLKVEPSEESSLQIEEILDELKFYGNIKIEDEIPGCLVYMDKLKLSQVLDNVVSNANKYAGTAIHVSFVEEREGILIRLRDYGQGILEEELPCVMEKYYRGSNTKGKTGSGLGLYLANMFMERMYGVWECQKQ